MAYQCSERIPFTYGWGIVDGDWGSDVWGGLLPETTERKGHRAQALVRHLFLPLHSRSRSSRIVHSSLTYPYSYVLGQNTENYYFTNFTTGTRLAATSPDRVLQYYSTTPLARLRSNSIEAVPPILLTSFPAPIPSRAFAFPSLPCPPFAPRARAFTKPKEELLKCSDYSR